MGLPEPIEPEPDDSPREPAGKARADWLCGAEEGLEAELDRVERDRRNAAAGPRLIRPGADAPPESPPSREGPVTPAPRLTMPSAPEAPAGTPLPPGGPQKRGPGAVSADETGSGFSHGPAMLWEPGANSVPTMPRASASAPVAPRPQASSRASELDFPMDDLEDRARAAAEPPVAAGAAANHGPRPHAVVAPDAFDVKDAPVPWWMRVPQMLREDRKVQVLVGLVAALLLVMAFWPKPEKSLSIGAIFRDPARYDGRDVRVSGRVGEVFQVGGGYAFYLHQRLDTLVVFSRFRSPRRGQNLTLVGTISTGYLNGQSGTALFESSAK